MFRVLLFTALAAIALAKPHRFLAERNFICSMCEQAVKLASKKDTAKVSKLCEDGRGKQYTPVCKKVLANFDTIRKLKAKSSHDICAKLQMCHHNVVYKGIDARYERPAINLTLIEHVSRSQKKWVSGINKRFLGMSLNDVRKQLGAVVDNRHTYKLPVKKYTKKQVKNAIQAGNFDVRQQWPKCASVSGDIRDQSACGSCWAFGSTEAYNDRKCIASDGAFTTLLSPADTNSCCGMFECGSQGCNGGQPTAAWRWFSRTGVVTGGDYKDNGQTDTCEPYTFAPCAHHVTSPDYKPCPKSEYSTPSCKKTCSNSGYNTAFAKDKHKATEAYTLDSNSQIMADMSKYGSATAAFTVYEDFLHYKSGVYKHTTGQALGGHAIKFLGFGTENGDDYWLVANSWNSEWGDGGTFKIARGNDECGIESQVSAGHA